MDRKFIYQRKISLITLCSWKQKLELRVGVFGFLDYKLYSGQQKQPFLIIKLDFWY